MPKRLFTEAQKEVNRKRTKVWRVAAKEKGPEYLEKARDYSLVSVKLIFLL